MQYSTIGLAGFATLVALAGACSDDESTNPSTGGKGGSGGNAGMGGSTTAGNGGTAGSAGGAECVAPEPEHMGDSGTIDSITVAYIDQDDAPGAGIQTTVCGTNICSDPATSDANGDVVVDASAIASFDNPRFNMSQNALEFAKIGSLIPAPDHDFGTVRAFRMPAMGAGVDIVAGTPATQNGVTLDVAAEATVEFDLIDVPEPWRKLRGLVVDLTAFPAAELPGVDATLNIEVLVVAMPLGTHICPAATLTFDNVAGWAAGAEVNIYLNGAKTFEHYAPYGQWALVAEGVVDADGTTVTTTADHGVETLGTFGAALK